MIPRRADDAARLEADHLERALGADVEAITHLRRVIEISPRNADADRNLAVALGLPGKLEEAIHHDRTSLRLQPGSAATRHHLGALLKAIGKPVSPPIRQ